MTITELRELTDFPFECFAMYSSPADEIMFAAPIPSPYGDGLHWHKTEDGSFNVEGDVETQKNYETMQAQGEIEDIPFGQYYDKSPQAVSNLDLPTPRKV